MAEYENSGFAASLKKNPSLRVEGAVEALGGSEALYEKVIAQVVQLIPSHIEGMDRFLEGDGDLYSFGIKAHGIKGSLRQIGCPGLAKSAEDLEMAAKARDRQYCDENYGVFKENLLHLRKEISDALPSADASGAGGVRGIADYYDSLCRAKEAAEEYDSIIAAEIISQLTGVRFGEEIDTLVSAAARELGLFRTEQALNYIVELIDRCVTARRGE